VTETLKAQLYSTLQSKRSSGSGTGTSFYGISATCGMKGRLYEMFPYEEEEQEFELGQVTATGRKKANGKRAGTFFHALQEYWRTGVVPSDVVFDVSHEDYDYELALRSFNNYRTRYGNDIHNRGTIIDAEVKYPATPEQATLITDLLGGLPFTVRYDLKTTLTEAHVEQLMVEYGLFVPGPGDYLIDYKLLASISPAQLNEYRRGFQGLAYPVIHNICNPDKPVRGMIFDITARVAKPELRHFEVVLAEVNDDAIRVVKDGVRLARDNYDAGRANPISGCFGRYGECAFSKNALCPKYGKFVDHESRFIAAKRT
jgi:hypothetical protein